MEICDLGQRPPLGEVPEKMHAMRSGPYYAINAGIRSKRFPCPTLTLGGLVVDERTGQVQGEDGRARAGELLERVGLGDRGHHYPAQLSGGEQQRVAIARAIAKRPEVLLCDEPTGDLDRKSGDEILDLLQALHSEHGKTILMVTHERYIAEHASREIRLHDGAILHAAHEGRPNDRPDEPPSFDRPGP